MNKQNLIIFKFKSLYQIMKELEENLNFKIFETENEKILKDKTTSLQNYLIITQKKIDDLNNQFILNKIPIKISKLVEIINIEFLKLQFNEKSELNIGKYKIDLNSRKLILKDIFLKLTEKEANIIIYLSKSNNAVRINELQSEVWGYHSELETHTVETHIYRLRKKIKSKFADEAFILNDKDGYLL